MFQVGEEHGFHREQPGDSRVRAGEMPRQHREPGLHWSLTKKAHEERVRPTLHPALDQPSVIAYCFRSFIYPGKRVRFDGMPVVLPPLEPDRDWVKPEDVGVPEGAEPA